MVHDETIRTEQPTSDLGDDVVINVPFPYLSPEKIEDSLELSKEPDVKIDYSSADLPSPKKAVPARRSNQQTRLVRLEERLQQDSDASKSAENLPGTSKNAAPDDFSAKNEEISEAMQKLLQSVDDFSRTAQENQRQYGVIAQALEKQSTALPKLEALQKHLDQSHKVETANQRLFDAMHGELKGYKDNFLFDALQKPVIRDLLALFDDLCGQARRMEQFLAGSNTPVDSPVNWKAELQASHDNINNTVFFIIEVLNRLDVTMIEGNDGVVDLKLHKVVGVEPTEVIEEKNHIARVVRPGFVWKERILRPTEVIVKKYSHALVDEMDSI